MVPRHRLGRIPAGSQTLMLRRDLEARTSPGRVIERDGQSHVANRRATAVVGGTRGVRLELQPRQGTVGRSGQRGCAPPHGDHRQRPPALRHARTDLPPDRSTDSISGVCMLRAQLHPGDGQVPSEEVACKVTHVPAERARQSPITANRKMCLALISLPWRPVDRTKVPARLRRAARARWLAFSP